MAQMFAARDGECSYRCKDAPTYTFPRVLYVKASSSRGRTRQFNELPIHHLFHSLILITSLPPNSVFWPFRISPFIHLHLQTYHILINFGISRKPGYSALQRPDIWLSHWPRDRLKVGADGKPNIRFIFTLQSHTSSLYCL